MKRTSEILDRCRNLTGLFICLAMVTACQQSGAEDRCDAVAGDLVFSELMIDPAGADENKEWIEIFNASSRGVVLEGLIIERISRSENESGEFDDVTKASHALRTSKILSSGSYFVMGDADAVVEPLDYSYDERDDSGRRLGAALGALPKTPSGLVLKCGGREIDRVVWGDESRPLPSSGIALSLDGATTPDSILNDDFSRWCEATDAYDDEGNLGTPGQANLPCGVTTCTDDLGSRETVPPGVGDIIVTEVYADPSGTDSNKEWLEIVSQSDRALDLNKVAIRVTKTDTGSASTFSIESDACESIASTQRYVIGGASDLAINGGVDVDLALDGFSLYNGSELLIEILHLDTVISTAIIPASEEAASWSLIEGEENSWCLSRANGFFEGAGTPGLGNTCGATCYDTDGELWRVTREPASADLIISEILADPEGADTGKEFVEVFSAGTETFDLNGLVLTFTANEADATPRPLLIGGENCATITPGSYRVLAAQVDPTLNGGLQDVVPVLGLTILNSKPLIITLDGAVRIDETVVPEAESGQSWQLRPQQLSDGTNESETDFCLSRARGIFEGLGTPSEPNTCGFTCLDNGTAREVNAPGLGDLVISEVLANPVGADAGRDWLELTHVGDSDIDLNGVRVEASNGTSTKGWDIEAEACLTVSPQERKVIGGQGLRTEGFVPFAEIGTATDTLFYASNLSLAVLVEELPVDSAGPLSVSEGTSTQLSADLMSAEGNDASVAWCISSGIFPETPAGTPGEENGTCP